MLDKKVHDIIQHVLGVDFDAEQSREKALNPVHFGTEPIKAKIQEEPENKRHIIEVTDKEIDRFYSKIEELYGTDEEVSVSQAMLEMSEQGGFYGFAEFCVHTTNTFIEMESNALEEKGLDSRKNKHLKECMCISIIMMKIMIAYQNSRGDTTAYRALESVAQGKASLEGLPSHMVTWDTLGMIGSAKMVEMADELSKIRDGTGKTAHTSACLAFLGAAIYQELTDNNRQLQDSFVFATRVHRRILNTIRASWHEAKEALSNIASNDVL